MNIDIAALPQRPQDVNINGVKIHGSYLVDLLNMVTDPIPGRRYRFKRIGDTIHISTKQED